MSETIRTERWSRRRILGVLAAVSAVPVLQACGGLAPASKPAEPTKPAETKPAAAATTTAPAAAATPAAKAPAASGVTIEVATRGGGDGEIMEKSIIDFAKETGIQAKHVAYGNEPEYWAKIQSLHATKQVADVIWASVGNLHNFANRGLLAELDPVIKGDNYDLGDYVPNGLNSLKLNGKLYAMPWGGHPGNSGLLYNLDLLEKEGIKAPDASWTLDTAMDAAKKLTKLSGNRTEQFGYVPGTDFLSLNNYVGAFGGDFLSADGKTLQIDDPKVKQGLNWVRDMFVTHKAAPVPGQDVNTTNLFASGKVALLHTGYGGHFSPGEKVIAGKFKWGLDLIPKGPGGKYGTSLTINGLTISAISTKQKEGWQLIKWLMEPKNHVPAVLAGGSRPALRNSVLDNKELTEKLMAHKRFADLIRVSEPWKMPHNYRWPEFNSTISQVFADVWTGKQTLDEAMPEAKKKLQAVLDKAAID